MIWVTLGLVAGAIVGGLYWLMRLPPGLKLPLLHSTQFRMLIFWIRSMYTFQSTPHMTISAHYYQLMTGLTVIFRKEGAVCLPYLLGNIAMVFKPEFVEKVLKRSNTHPKEIFVLRDVLDTGLITNEPPLWNHRRKINTPAFAVPLLDNTLDTLNKNGRRLLKKFYNQNDIDPDIDVTEMFGYNFIENFLGVEGEIITKDIDFDLRVIDRTEVLLAERLVNPIKWFTSLFYLMPSGKEQHHIKNCVKELVYKLIDIRLEKLKERGDMIEYLKKGNEDKNLILLDNLLYHQLVAKDIDQVGVLDEVKTLLTAATDAPVLSFIYTIYMLGLHPDFQKKVQEEIDAIFADDPDRDVTLDDLRQLKLVDLAIKEALRILPAIFMTSREAVEDLEFGDYKIPKGTSIMIPFHGTHRDERFFPNPEIYDPYRFLPENSHNRHPYSFLAFSGGQRNCIGQRYGRMEIQILLVHLLRRVNMRSLRPLDKMNYEFHISLRCGKPGCRMSFLAREDIARGKSFQG